jgi:hypothetical protein
MGRTDQSSERKLSLGCEPSLARRERHVKVSVGVGLPLRVGGLAFGSAEPNRTQIQHSNLKVQVRFLAGALKNACKRRR